MLCALPAYQERAQEREAHPSAIYAVASAAALQLNNIIFKAAASAAIWAARTQMDC